MRLVVYIYTCLSLCSSFVIRACGPGLGSKAKVQGISNEGLGPRTGSRARVLGRALQSIIESKERREIQGIYN